MRFPPSDQGGDFILERFGDKYAYFQLQKAMESGQSDKADKWKKVFSGMLSGDLAIGARAPIKNIPNWVTPEVVRGGFVTGDFKAGGALKPHEIQLAKELYVRDKSASQVREYLNQWYLSQDGFARLGDMLESGHYRAETPEELALLTVCAFARDHSRVASEVLKKITPFFDRLRFYPRPVSTPPPDGFFRQSVYRLNSQLADIKPRASIKVQANVLNDWIPVYDRLLDLLENQKRVSWKSDVQDLLSDVEKLTSPKTPRRWSDKDRPFRRCLKVIEQLLSDQAVPERDQNYVQLVLKRHKEKYGNPESKQKFRAQQKQQNVDYWHDDLAKEIMEKLDGLDPESGISNPARLITRLGPQVPNSMVRKIELTRMGTLERLIKFGQIGSQEVLAGFIPRVSAKVVAAGIEHPAYRALYQNLYQSFHERRSLLLLNLESQTRLEELPWAAAFENVDTGKQDVADASTATLSEIASLVLNHFPQSQFSNPLVEQFIALKKKSGLSVIFVPELAADIFMGHFSRNFGLAAKASNEFMKDTVYGRYYDLPDHVDPASLGEFCSQRAGDKKRQGGSWVAQNGMVIEQAMILTSHNMASVLENFDLDVNFSASVLKCFDFVVKTLREVPATRYLELIALKNSAYAWRQMLALLTQLDRNEQEACFRRMQEKFSAEAPSFQKFFEPIFRGLEQTLNRDRIQNEIFLGWSSGRHPYSRH